MKARTRTGSRNTWIYLSLLACWPATAVAQSAPSGGGRPPAAEPTFTLPGTKPAATPPKPAPAGAVSLPSAVVLGPVPLPMTASDRILTAAADALGDIGLPAAKDGPVVKVSSSANVSFQVVKKRCDFSGKCTDEAVVSSGTGMATIDYGSTLQDAGFGLTRVVLSPIPGGVLFDEPPVVPPGHFLEPVVPPLKLGDAQKRFLGRFSSEVSAWCGDSSHKASPDWTAVCTSGAKAVSSDSALDDSKPTPEVTYSTGDDGSLLVLSAGLFRTWVDDAETAKSALAGYQHTTGLRLGLSGWGNKVAVNLPAEIGLSSDNGVWYRMGLTVGRSANLGPLFVGIRGGVAVSGETDQIPFAVEIPIAADAAFHFTSMTLVLWYETSSLFATADKRLSGSKRALWGDQSTLGIEALALGGSAWGFGYEARQMMDTTVNLIFLSRSKAMRN